MLQDYYLIQIADLKNISEIKNVLAQGNKEFRDLLDTLDKHRNYFILKVEVLGSFQTVGAFINEVKFEKEYKEKEYGIVMNEKYPSTSNDNNITFTDFLKLDEEKNEEEEKENDN